MDNKIKLGFFILSGAVVIIASMLFYGIASTANQAQETHRALCAIKSGYQNNLKSTEQYLRNHPDGAPVLGISAAQLERSIQKIKVQIQELRDIKCS